ncbi:MAG: GAF domain-containing protein [Bacteroidales bacterium]|nr:GAF domain-containing protein [Bacteroidales bacterium]MBQ2098331.1 GAF domain-containing protein [Bacteroidales bacterium]
MNEKRKAITILIIYIIVSIIFGLSAFKYLAPKFISANAIIGIYALVSIAMTAYALVTVRKIGLQQGGSISTAADYFADQDQKEKERKEQEKIDKELKRRREAEGKKAIAEKVEEMVADTEQITDPEKYFDQLLINLSKAIAIVQGVAYTLNRQTQTYSMVSTYAFYTTDTSRTFAIGEGIPGQVAKDKKLLFINDVPEGYIKIVSGLGTSSPKYMGVIPVIHGDETIALIEISTFEKPEVDLVEFQKQFNEKVSEKISTLIP